MTRTLSGLLWAHGTETVSCRYAARRRRRGAHRIYRRPAQISEPSRLFGEIEAVGKGMIGDPGIPLNAPCRKIIVPMTKQRAFHASIESVVAGIRRIHS